MAYTYTSSSTTIATVDANGMVTGVAPGIATITINAAGTGTGFSATTLTGAATVTVSALPAGLTALSVSPTSVTLSQGTTATVVANATQPSGAAAATITYGTTAPAVATVSDAGVITAVGAGSAVITVTATSAANSNFGAATLSATVAVTVNPAAQVAITTITTASGAPINVASVGGQINVQVNVATNGNIVSSAQLYACAVGATCPASGQEPVAQQTFGAGGAASGNITFNVNTAAFRVNSDWSAATTDFANGQQVLVATVTTAGGTSSATSNNTVLNFNNQDGFAAMHTAPANSAASAANANVIYYGGPGSNGRGSITIVPVTYTSGRTIVSASASVPANAGCGLAPTAIEFTSAARPWTYSYGTSLGAATGANATNIVCASAVANMDLTPVVTGSLYNDNTTGPTATGRLETGSVPNTFLTVASGSIAVNAPASIRVDYAAPSGGSIAIPTSGWLSGSASLSGSGTSSILTLATDGNVGLAPATVRYVRATGGCSTPTDTTTITISATSHDIPECVGNNSNAVYTAHYYPVDRLGNVGLRVASSASFGIDRTAPQIRFTTDTAIMAPDQSINSTKTNAFRIEALDERSGLTSAAGVSFTRTLRRSSSLANSGWAAASDNFCNGLAAATGTTGFGSLFITGPVCAYSTTGNDFTGALTADGYSIAPAVTMASLGTTGSGYYTYRARVSDEAGNTAEITRRVVLADAVAPSASATVTIAPISSTYAGPFAGSFVDDVETRGTGLVVNYGGSLALAYPMQATSAVAFDNVITRDSLFTGTTPFTSGVLLYTDLEATSSGAPQGNTGLAQLSGFSVYAQDFGDNRRTSSPANFLGGSITNDAAVWNSNGSGTKFASATQQIATFSVVPSTETFNSPAGGLKAQAIGPSNTFNSPFTRVDFYRQIPTTTTWEFVGSVDGTAVPCQNVAQTCNVYIGEGAGQRAITYVLRQGGTGATSFNPIALNDGTYIAIGTTGTKGRGLLSDTDTFAPPAPPAP